MQEQPTNHILIQSEGVNTSITIYSAERIVLPKQVTRDLRDSTSGLLHVVSVEDQCLKFNFNNRYSENPLTGYTLNWLFRHLFTENIVSMQYLVALKHHLQMKCSTGNQIVQALKMVTICHDRSDICTKNPVDVFSNVEAFTVGKDLTIEIKNTELHAFLLELKSESDGNEIQLIIDDRETIEKMNEIVTRCQSRNNFSEFSQFLRSYGETSTEIAGYIDRAENRPVVVNNTARFAYATTSVTRSGVQIEPVDKSAGNPGPSFAPLD